MSQDDTGQVWPKRSEPEPQLQPESQPAVLTGEPAQLDEGQRLDVEKCAACDNRHQGIAVFSFNRPVPPFTHWYACPALGDPVPIALAMLKAGGGIELHGPIINHLAAAQTAGRFLAAIFWHEDGKLRMGLTTHKFPHADYFEADDQKGVLGMLREKLEEYAGAPQTRDMRRAPPLMPLRTLLGTAEPSDGQEMQLPKGSTAEGIGKVIDQAIRQ